MVISKREKFELNSQQNRKKLKVLVVSHTYVVGVNQGKLKAIVDTNKVEVGLLVPSNWKSTGWNKTFEVENPYPQIKIFSAPVAFSGRGGAHIYSPWKIRQVLKSFQPDLVQIEEEIFSLCAFEFSIWSRFYGKPLAIFGWENLERNLSFPRQWVCNFVMKTAQLYIAGNQDGSRIIKNCGYKGKVEIMPQMGVDTHLFSPKIRSKNEENFNIGFVGRLIPDKGIDILFKAAQALKEKKLKFQIIICGSGVEEENLKQQAKTQDIEDLVVWRAAVSHGLVPKEMSNFDVLVLPSRSTNTWKEQFGHVLIEAMAMGIPTIGSDCGEIPNVIGRDDLIFEEEQSEQLAKILEGMICNISWRKEIEQYSLDRVKNYYSHEKIAERLVNLWKYQGSNK